MAIQPTNTPIAAQQLTILDLPSELLSQILFYAHSGKRPIAEKEIEVAIQAVPPHQVALPHQVRREEEALDPFLSRTVCKLFREILDKEIGLETTFGTLLKKLQETSDLFGSVNIGNLSETPGFLGLTLPAKISYVSFIAQANLRAINDRVTDEDFRAPKQSNFSPVDQLIYQARWLEAQKGRSYSDLLARIRRLIGRGSIPQIQHEPKILLTGQVCSAAIQCHGALLEHVPVPLRTEKMCLMAIRHVAGSAVDIFPYIPGGLKTYGFFFKAVQVNMYIFKQIPQMHRTVALCLEAAKKNGTIIGEVSFDVILAHPEIFDIAIRQSGKSLESLQRRITDIEKTVEDLRRIDAIEDALGLEAQQTFLEDLITFDRCLIAVQNCGEALKFVPERIKLEHPELYLIAIQKSWKVIQDLPIQEKTLERCLEAVRQNRSALEGIPEEIKTHDFYLAAIRLNWKVLLSIPKAERTFEMCLEAVLQDVSALAHVPHEYFDQVREIKEARDRAQRIEPAQKKRRTEPN